MDLEALPATVGLFCYVLYACFFCCEQMLGSTWGPTSSDFWLGSGGVHFICDQNLLGAKSFDYNQGHLAKEALVGPESATNRIMGRFVGLGAS